jgi:hypothetical protein
MPEIREAVRNRYASKAKTLGADASCCGPECCAPAAADAETISCGQDYEEPS